MKCFDEIKKKRKQNSRKYSKIDYEIIGFSDDNKNAFLFTYAERTKNGMLKIHTKNKE